MQNFKKQVFSYRCTSADEKYNIIDRLLELGYEVGIRAGSQPYWWNRPNHDFEREQGFNMRPIIYIRRVANHFIIEGAAFIATSTPITKEQLYNHLNSYKPRTNKEVLQQKRNKLYENKTI